MNIYFLSSQVERKLLKTLWQHSLAQMAGILVDILFVIILFIYFNQLWLWIILWQPITRKIRVAQKNVIEEKLLEIKRSIRRGYRGMYLFQIRSVFFSIITFSFKVISKKSLFSFILSLLCIFCCTIWIWNPFFAGSNL